MAPRPASALTQTGVYAAGLVLLGGVLVGMLVHEQDSRRLELRQAQLDSGRLTGAVDALVDRHNRSLRRAREALLEPPDTRVAMLAWGAEHYLSETERHLAEVSRRVGDGGNRGDRPRDAVLGTLADARTSADAVAVGLQGLLDAVASDDPEATANAQRELARADRRMSQALGRLRADAAAWAMERTSAAVRAGPSVILLIASLLCAWAVVGGGLVLRTLSSLRRIAHLPTAAPTAPPRSLEEAELSAALAREGRTAGEASRKADEISRDHEQQRALLRRAERDLALLRIYNDNLVNSLRAAIVVTDLELRVASVNHAARRLFGLGEAAIGTPLAESSLGVTLAQRDPQVSVNLASGLADKRALSFESLPVGGTEGPLVDVAIVPYLDEVGAARGLIIVADDVTERVRTKNQLLATEHLAAIGRISAQVAHEIRNPLSAIGLNAELLSEEVSALPPARRDEAQKLASAMAAEIERLTQITEGYLRLARMPRPVRRGCDVNALVADLVTMLREELRAHAVEVRLDLASNGPQAYADPGQLRQALLNVIKNSREAMPNGGMLRVSTGSEGDFALVRVDDNGPGMPPEVQRRVFEPFFTTKPEGTGLGLSLTQQIISEHGGHIEVGNAPGGGTTVALAFPSPQAAARVAGGSSSHLVPDIT